VDIGIVRYKQLGIACLGSHIQLTGRSIAMSLIKTITQDTRLVAMGDTISQITQLTHHSQKKEAQTGKRPEAAARAA